MRVVCGGCGGLLPERSGSRWRPARYHGAACRQRARRARMATEPGPVELLAVAERTERAAGALRRAVTVSGDIRAALQRHVAAEIVGGTWHHQPATATYERRDIPGGRFGGRNDSDECRRSRCHPEGWHVRAIRDGG
jgi:hypothetical protein